MGSGYCEGPLISSKNTNGRKVSLVASSAEDCIHPVRSRGAPVPRPASPWRSSLWLHTALALWFYQSASLLPLFPALHVDSYHWTNGVSCVQTRRHEKGKKTQRGTEQEIGRNTLRVMSHPNRHVWVTTRHVGAILIHLATFFVHRNSSLHCGYVVRYVSHVSSP